MTGSRTSTQARHSSVSVTHTNHKLPDENTDKNHRHLPSMRLLAGTRSPLVPCSAPSVPDNPKSPLHSSLNTMKEPPLLFYQSPSGHKTSISHPTVRPLPWTHPSHMRTSNATTLLLHPSLSDAAHPSLLKVLAAMLFWPQCLISRPWDNFTSSFSLLPRTRTKILKGNIMKVPSSTFS